MKAIKLFGFLGFLLCAFVLQAQNPLDFFPHHEGDIWEYHDYVSGELAQNRIIKDSLGSDGKYYLETSFFGPMIVDTINHSVYNHSGYVPNGDLRLWFKLDADSGDSWTVIGDTSSLPMAAKVNYVYQSYVLGVLSTIKRFDFYYVFGPESLWAVSQHLAEGFGVVREDAEFVPYNLLLRGAIIDSVQYGHVTAVQNKKLVPQDMTLHQNYPNPFNPTTTIRYELPVAANVELSVYDILGRVVKKLVDEHQPAGRYEVQFDASGLSSGVYVYELKTGKSVLRRRMVLMR